MRIGIDARRLTHRRLDGRLSYLRNALTALLQAGDQHDYVLYVDGPLVPEPPLDRANVRLEALPRRFGRLGTAFNDWWRLGAASGRHGLSGFHLPVDPYARLRVPYVVTAHDLTIFQPHYRCDLPLGQYLQIEAVRRYSRLTFADVVSRARRVICITEQMKQDFQRHMGLSGSQMCVVYPGGDNAAFHIIDDEDALAAFRQRMGVGQRFVMGFGNKNLPVLLRAFACLPAGLRSDWTLVVTGPTLQPKRLLDEMTSRLDLVGRVAFFPWPIPAEELCWFYNAASLFVLPSQYEMFCNMLLEAMRCRCPVLASRLPANEEVGSDAIAYYDGINDPESLAGALTRILDDREALQGLARRGHARGAEFTWHRHATGLLTVYAQAFG